MCLPCPISGGFDFPGGPMSGKSILSHPRCWCPSGSQQFSGTSALALVWPVLRTATGSTGDSWATVSHCSAKPSSGFSVQPDKIWLFKHGLIIPNLMPSPAAPPFLSWCSCPPHPSHNLLIPNSRKSLPEDIHISLFYLTKSLVKHDAIRSALVSLTE